MVRLLARRSIIQGGWTPALATLGQRVSVPVAIQQTGRKNSTVQCPCILSPGRNVRAVVEEGVDGNGGKVVVVMLKEGSDDDVMDTGSRWPVAV